MSKAFLSHSSFDKDFVHAVYNRLGAAKANYDFATFKRNGDLAEQIRLGLLNSQIYVIFCSRAALSSKWVSSELDVASELKARWSITRFLAFQLDDTPWSELPEWMARYVIACPPSPEQVALRILDELRSVNGTRTQCIGREDDTRKISVELMEREPCPSFIFLSGTAGIGRRTLAKEVFKKIYPMLAEHLISISIHPYDDLVSIHRRLLAFSSNWRARDLLEKSNDFEALSTIQKVAEVSRLIYEVAVNFRQVVVIDVGSNALDEFGKPVDWLASLLDTLGPADYPYVWIISQRYMPPRFGEKGLFFQVNPLNAMYSNFLFSVLLKEHGISIPNKLERDSVESAVSGHPGLISVVVNHLKINPAYKPNKTHNNIVKLINAEVERILAELTSRKPELETVVALFAETGVMSYDEIVSVSSEWDQLDELISDLIDSGVVIVSDGQYELAPYLIRGTQSLPEKYKQHLRVARKILFERVEKISGDDFVPANILDPRIVEIIASGSEVKGYAKNLIMPSQLLRAAKKNYDAQNYGTSLRLAKECFEQSYKLSDKGKLESLRIVGLSAIRIPDNAAFDFFQETIGTLEKSKARDAILDFAMGFSARYAGNLRAARDRFSRIEKYGAADSHVYRELSYIYAFEGDFDAALAAAEKGLRLAAGNSYLLDVKCFSLLEKYKSQRKHEIAAEIDDCLELLKRADERDGTHFYPIRSSARNVLLERDVSSLMAAYEHRGSLPTMAKAYLLDLLSYYGKDLQYQNLLSELSRIRRTNKLADIELAKIEIGYQIANGHLADAEKIISRFSSRFTEKSERELRDHVSRSAGFR